MGGQEWYAEEHQDSRNVNKMKFDIQSVLSGIGTSMMGLYNTIVKEGYLLYVIIGLVALFGIWIWSGG